MSIEQSHARAGFDPAEAAGRAALFLFGAAVAVIAAYVMLRCLGVVEAGSLLPERIAQGPLLDWIDPLPLRLRLASAGGALLVGLLTLSMMLGGGGRAKARARSGSPARVHVLQADERGLVLIASDGVEAVARSAAEAAPGVMEADARVRRRGEGVSLDLDIEVLEGADLRRAGMQARERTVQAIERLVGIDVVRVNVHVDMLEADGIARGLR